MTTPARPGSFTGATDNSSSGGLFSDSLVDGIPDIVGADVASAQASATAAASSAASAATSASSAAGSAVTATDASTTATDAASTASTDAETATTKAGEAAESATTATTKAGEAAEDADSANESASNASGSETAAAASQTAASTSAGNALTSATAANTAKLAAEAALALFTDSYIGAYASDAAADTAAGAALTEGDLYFNTVLDQMKVCSAVNTGTGTWLTLTPTAANQININKVAVIETEVIEVAAIDAEIIAVAAIDTEVGEVAAIDTEVIAVAGDAVDIGTVATDLTGSDTIGTVASQITPTNNIQTVATASPDIGTVATDLTGSNTVGTVAANLSGTDTIGTVATGIADVNAVGTDLTGVDTIGTVATDLSGTNTIGTVAADLSGSNTIGTVSTNIANVNLVGPSITNVNTVAANIANVNTFANTYFVSATAPGSPTEGDLWFDTTANVMKVYNGTAWVAASSTVNGTAQRVNYTATAGQSTFTATYDVGFVDVYLNGIKLIETTDFTATNGTSIVLTSPAAVDDTVDIVGYGLFELANFSINDANDVNTSGATTGQFLKYDGADWVADNVPAGGIAAVVDDTSPQLGGTLDVNSNDIDFGQSNKALFGGVGGDLEIYHNGTNAYIDNNDGNLYIRNNVDDDDGGNIIIQAKSGENSIYIHDDGAVNLYYDAVAKLETRIPGIHVYGDVSVTNGDLSEVLISQIIPSGSPTLIDFDNLPTTYDTYRFDFNLDVVAANNEIYVRVISSTTGGVVASANAYFYDKLTNGTRSFTGAGTTAIQICSSTSGANDNRGIRGSMYVYGRNMNFNSSADTMPMFTWSLVNLNNTGVHETVTGGASLNPSGALSLGAGMRGVRFYSSTNFNNQGFISVYGIRSTPI